MREGKRVCRRGEVCNSGRRVDRTLGEERRRGLSKETKEEEGEVGGWERRKWMK